MSFYITKLCVIDDGVGIIVPDEIVQKFNVTKNTKAFASPGLNEIHIKFDNSDCNPNSKQPKKNEGPKNI
jgi:hypothetical protein